MGAVQLASLKRRMHRRNDFFVVIRSITTTLNNHIVRAEQGPFLACRGYDFVFSLVRLPTRSWNDDVMPMRLAQTMVINIIQSAVYYIVYI